MEPFITDGEDEAAAEGEFIPPEGQPVEDAPPNRVVVHCPSRELPTVLIHRPRRRRVWPVGLAVLLVVGVVYARTRARGAPVHAPATTARASAAPAAPATPSREARPDRGEQVPAPARVEVPPPVAAAVDASSPPSGSVRVRHAPPAPTPAPAAPVPEVPSTSASPLPAEPPGAKTAAPAQPRSHLDEHPEF